MTATPERNQHTPKSIQEAIIQQTRNETDELKTSTINTHLRILENRKPKENLENPSTSEVLFANNEKDFVHKLDKNITLLPSSLQQSINFLTTYPQRAFSMPNASETWEKILKVWQETITSKRQEIQNTKNPQEKIQASKDIENLIQQFSALWGKTIFFGNTGIAFASRDIGRILGSLLQRCVAGYTTPIEISYIISSSLSLIKQNFGKTFLKNANSPMETFNPLILHGYGKNVLENVQPHWKEIFSMYDSELFWIQLLGKSVGDEDVIQDDMLTIGSDQDIHITPDSSLKKALIDLQKNPEWEKYAKKMIFSSNDKTTTLWEQVDNLKNNTPLFVYN